MLHSTVSYLNYNIIQIETSRKDETDTGKVEEEDEEKMDDSKSKKKKKKQKLTQPLTLELGALIDALQVLCVSLYMSMYQGLPWNQEH